ncbi:MAG: chromosome partitioning protein [Legionellales bacterium]|nr:chromosome partitioning protein [Legionellales bacterium]OUX67068.1 MAG: chromosome partitioning protein [bacterium TMED178]|tara:strand:- start:3786 stop:4565 length:780 start_codon:yes stop_codon:yes gene_type:complete
MGAGRVIAITNQKGGVGKTTTAVNLCAGLAALKKRALLIDLDPQGNASSSSGYIHSDGATIYDILCQNTDIMKSIKDTPEGFDLIPTIGNLTAAEIKLINSTRREKTLKYVIEPCLNHYEYIVIDCPPSLNILTVNALVAANSVIIPVQCEYFALEGLAKLMRTIEQLKASINTSLAIEGLLRTMYDGRNRLSHEVSEQILEHFSGSVYETIVPRNVRLAEAPSHGMSALRYDQFCQGAIAYLALAAEVAKKTGAVHEF